MAPAVDFDAIYVKRPQVAARTRAWHLRRIAILESGGRATGRFETVEEHQRTADRYEQALRAKGFCIADNCGRRLDDQLSVWRGIGPDCWARMTPAERAAAGRRAEQLNGPWPPAPTASAITDAALDLAAADDGLDMGDRF